MTTQNLKKYPVVCGHCGGSNFSRGTHMELGPNGMLNREGDYICLECNQRLDLAKAVRQAEMMRKQEELKSLQDEYETMEGA